MQVQSASATQTASTLSSISQQQLSSDDFLTLLVAQLTNQDPLEPMDSSQFMSQLSELESVAQLQEINSNLKEAGQISGPLNTLGRTVYWEDTSGLIQSGTVSAVEKSSEGSYQLAVDDMLVDFDQVVRIQ